MSNSDYAYTPNAREFPTDTPQESVARQVLSFIKSALYAHGMFCAAPGCVRCSALHTELTARKANLVTVAPLPDPVALADKHLEAGVAPKPMDKPIE